MCVNLQNMKEAALFSGSFYTADKNFTRPPVATVATNSKSDFIQSFTKLSFRRLMISCGFIQTIMSVGLCFYSKSFQEGEKKDEWKSDNGFVGNKTETFPQLHHLPPWLHLYPTTSSLSPLSYSIFISIPQLHFCHPYKSIIYPLALSLSNNFIIVIRLCFPQLHHLPPWVFFITQHYHPYTLL